MPDWSAAAGLDNLHIFIASHEFNASSGLSFSFSSTTQNRKSILELEGINVDVVTSIYETSKNLDNASLEAWLETSLSHGISEGVFWRTLLAGCMGAHAGKRFDGRGGAAPSSVIRDAHLPALAATARQYLDHQRNERLSFDIAFGSNQHFFHERLFRYPARLPALRNGVWPPRTGVE